MSRIMVTDGNESAVVRPLVAEPCGCHGEPMTWNLDAGRKAGGRWRCTRRKLESTQRWRQRNPEKDRLASRKSAREWQKANPDRRLAQQRRYRTVHLEAELERLRLWKRAHREQRCNESRVRRARKAGVASDGHRRSEVFERDGGICQLCGVELDPKNWHEDHVIPIVIGGSDMLDNVQATCPPCNMRKGGRVA